MAFVSFSRCSNEARSSGGAFGVAVPGLPLFCVDGVGGTAGAEGLAVGFELEGAVFGTICGAERAVGDGEGAAAPLAGAIGATSAGAATAARDASSCTGWATAGAVLSVVTVGALFWDGECAGEERSAAQADTKSTKKSATTLVTSDLRHRPCVSGAKPAHSLHLHRHRLWAQSARATLTPRRPAMSRASNRDPISLSLCCMATRALATSP